VHRTDAETGTLVYSVQVFGYLYKRSTMVNVLIGWVSVDNKLLKLIIFFKEN